MITGAAKDVGDTSGEEPGLIAIAHPGEIAGSRSRRLLKLSEMVVHVLDEGGNLLAVANLHGQCAQRAPRQRDSPSGAATTAG